MCFRPCSVAMAFSILRATSVSSCAGAAPGSDALTLTVGRSMSGKFCTFMALKDRKPPNVSSTNSITAGIGLRIDQEETFIMGMALLALGGGCGRHRRVDQPHQISIVEESRPGSDDAGVGCQPADDLQLVPQQTAGLHLALAHARVRVEPVLVAEAVADHHGGLGYCHRRRRAQVELA